MLPKPAGSCEIKHLIITGLSGAGKSHARSVLEDIGYFVVDNIPPQMIMPLIDLMQKDGTTNKIATILDMRSLKKPADFSNLLEQLSANQIDYQVIFIEADDTELVKRYEKVRRPHPLQKGNTPSSGSILDGVQKERADLQLVRNTADIVIDTTQFSVHDFARELIKALGKNDKRELKIHVMSFGFKHGLPIDAENVFDVRFLPNPFWVDALRDKTGKDEAVADYVLKNSKGEDYVQKVFNLITPILGDFLHENKQNITIAFGCTGGRHRSVACGERLAHLLQSVGYKISIAHRDIKKGDN